MSVQSEITRLANAKTALATSIEGKGVTVPEGTKLDGMAALVEAIEGGGGGGVETCTVEFRSNIPDEVARYVYSKVILPVFENGKTTIKTFTEIKNFITIPNVICNSLAYIELAGDPTSVSASNTTTIEDGIAFSPRYKLLKFVGDAIYTVQMTVAGGGGGDN